MLSGINGSWVISSIQLTSRRVGAMVLDHISKIVFAEVTTQNSRKQSPTLLESETSKQLMRPADT